jgi:hypothetical protein
VREGSPNNPHKHWSVGYPIVPDWWHDSPLSRWNHTARDEGTHRQHRSGYRSLGVSLATEEAEAYRTLQQNLRAVQFAPARNPDTGQEETFRWQRNVDGVRVLLEFFCPVGAGQPGQLLRNPGENVGSKISAVRTRGAELAGLDHFEITLHGELLDHGGIQEAVIARVGNLLPFVVLKAFATTKGTRARIPTT